MLKIGITGNIGSGKTTVCRVFELLGIPVFYSDDAAKQVMTTDTQLIKNLKQHFGNEAYFDNGTLNKKFISSIVFNNAAELNKLNSLVHPAVFRAFDAWIINHTAAPYVLKEAAILFESGSYKDCDHTILVTAPTPARLQRVIERDNITIEQAEARNSKQMPQEEKVKLADYIINNDNSALVIPQVLHLHKLFTRQ
ncbi:dephospho-CoA kinase [Mucilaginibacter aquatilis]|uniref:Dephospho-CoA kinase n=1 Tax=Mucilaginibacter aquatilis TaxID=1517760 RepID=A0A6I4IG31_9SPHI|nr:dephospho-CoA kinase [Mucilaginibacter aquatilis]MVN92319.1 dephospho-CoA kinase [Mucilaginibacter aquatilis]